MKRVLLLFTMILFSFNSFSATTSKVVENEMEFLLDNQNFENNLKVNALSLSSVKEKNLTAQKILKQVVWYAELSCGKTVIIIADVSSVDEMIDITMAVDLIVCGGVIYNEVY